MLSLLVRIAAKSPEGNIPRRQSRFPPGFFGRRVQPKILLMISPAGAVGYRMDDGQKPKVEVLAEGQRGWLRKILLRRRLPTSR